MHDIQTYQSPDGIEPYAEVRVQRMAAGNFGDCKPLDCGVWELRIDWDPAIACITRSQAAAWYCC